MYMLTPVSARPPMAYAVRRALLDLAAAHGDHIPLRHEDIARVARIDRPNASRELAKLKRAGVIEQHEGSLTVLDLDALKASVIA